MSLPPYMLYAALHTGQTIHAATASSWSIGSKLGLQTQTATEPLPYGKVSHVSQSHHPINQWINCSSLPVSHLKKKAKAKALAL